ncbi:predicted protein [Histoplasma capsulatum G186AR]|uniref:Uncharacterized protein n=1 Tax=Ajellomyces capsulatus (strain G186AR / H82 / ATCC MYA-2454 / RMSCC 2432) TaxID=447093 RepID=C0NF37_AJECG|nr:uncharacterized protein HCBG_01503 [Histoplasma capsulatum G186AR]EEH09858.1 predicted protein [Histoplasma capsulatum G186AR]
MMISRTLPATPTILWTTISPSRIDRKTSLMITTIVNPEEPDDWDNNVNKHQPLPPAGVLSAGDVHDYNNDINRSNERQEGYGHSELDAYLSSGNQGLGEGHNHHQHPQAPIPSFDIIPPENSHNNVKPHATDRDYLPSQRARYSYMNHQPPVASSTLTSDPRQSHGAGQWQRRSQYDDYQQQQDYLVDDWPVEAILYQNQNESQERR